MMLTNDQLFYLDEFGQTNHAFAISGCNDTDAKACQTGLVSPGFKGNEHPRECLNFFYDIQVYTKTVCIFV